MKRKLGFLMTLVIALCTSSAWAQSVVSVGTNLDFSEGTPVDNGICTYAKDIADNGTTYSQMLEVAGWTIEGENGDARAAGLFAYGSGYWLGGKGYNVPATNSAGVAEGNALGIVAVWSATAQYTQPVTLEAGDYVISIPVYNAVGGTSAPTKSLIGFIADNGTEYLAPAKAYAVDTWTVENIKFTLTEATTGKLSLGYAAPNTGSGGNQHLFFDKVEIMAVTETDLARIDLNAALVTAQTTVDAKAGVGAGLFMYSEEAYNTYAAAVAAAKAVSENAEATKDDLVAALAALNAATEAYVVTAPAADAVYTLKFNGTENYLTIGESNITIEATDDALSFEAVGNGKYYIHDKEGKYLSYAGTNNWTMTASADVKDEWAVSVNAEGLYTLTGKNGGLGVDGTEAGASCYGDKKGSAVALWAIAEIVIEEEPVVDPNDYTSYIVNADLSTTDAWNAEGTKGISGGMVKVGSQAVYDFSQTITLPAGQYKMTAKAVYRYGSDEQAEYDAIVAGTETHKTKLYAETATYKYEADVQNRYDGASDTDYAGSGTVTINGKYVPNSSAAVQAWFNAGQYVNELVFNVQEDGQIKIGITTVDGIAGDYGNIGAWTLTRLGDAEADPKEEEPTPETPIYTMVQNEADLVAGGKYLIMAEVADGWVALSDLSGKIRVPSCTLTVSENFTVETVVATAIAESPAIFEGAAYELTLEGEPGAWKFKDELNGAYLHWSSGNNLVNDATGSAWTIAFNQYAHNAVITHAVTTDRVLQYNASSPRFCAYTSVQKPVYLFKAGEVTVAPVAPSNPSFNTIAELLAFETGNMVELNVANAKITYLSGNNMSITDGTDTLAIYDYNIPAEYAVGGWLSGKITATLALYKGNKQLSPVDWSEVTFKTPITVESPWVGAAIENGVTYYLYNVKSNAFLKGGNDWGTRASFGEDAVAFVAEGSGNVYGLKSTYGSYLGDGLYVDQAKKDFVFDEVGEGIYTIAKDGAYVGYDGGNVVVTAAEVNDGSYWQLLTKESIVADMVAADATTPYHVTALITCANFGRNDQAISAWTGGPSVAGDNDNFCAEKWNAGISTVTQTLTGLPNGTYKLQAQGLYRMGSVDAAVALRDAGTEVYDVKFFANTDSVLVMSVMDEAGKLDGVGDAYGTYGTAPNNRNHASKFFNAGYYEHELYFTVTDGTAVIGVANNTGASADWLVFDNFRLTYYGTATVSEINKVRFFEVKNELDLLMNTCMSLYSLGAVNNAYMVVSDSALAIANDENATPEVINAYIPVMEAKIAEVKAIDEYYNNVFTPINDLCYETQQNSKANSDEVYAAFDEVCALAGFMNLYSNVASIEDLKVLADTLEDARRIYVVNAVPTEGFAFDYTFLAVNPDMADGTINGWTATEGWQFQSNQVYTGEGAQLDRFQERWTWGADLGNTSTVQTLSNLPNGIYRISADVMATRQDAEDPKGATTGAYWVANTDSVAVATANGTPERFTVETTVVDGNLTIGLVGVNTTANWMGLDNVTIEFCEAAPAVEPVGKKVVYDLNVERVAGLGYTAEDYTIATSELAALLGVESLGEATMWGVNPDGSYVADAMTVYDGWRAVDGTFAGWSSETAAVCVKLFAEEAAYLISICTHGDNGNDPAAGTQSTAVWALVAGIDTVVINTNITFIEPAIINIADYEVVSTIKVEHNETAGVAFSGNTASFDAAAVAAALGVTSLNDAEQYILNVTTGNLVVNSTDGWRNSQGDATAWGSLDEGSVCVKINDPASGTIDYIGCYDATFEVGEVYTAKWVFVHEGKAVVIEVVITFIPEEGIENIEAAEDAVIYTITGKRVQGNVKSLESGIYIVNGRKVLVK